MSVSVQNENKAKPGGHRSSCNLKKKPKKKNPETMFEPEGPGVLPVSQTKRCGG